jgi:hypothetical protein
MSSKTQPKRRAVMSAEKTVFISHGDKGGVGKSTLSMFLVESLLRDGKQVSLIESDPSSPDLSRRYGDDMGIVNSFLSLNQAGDAENAIAKFGNWLETSGGDNVVTNLPAGASETLDQYSDLITDICYGLGYRLVVTYCLEKTGLAADILEKSFKKGLMSVAKETERFVIFPEFKGAPEDFEWFSHPAREKYPASEIVMPAMKSKSAWRALDATPGRVANLIDKTNRPEGRMLADQASLYRFYRAGLDAVAPIFQG